MWVCLNHQKVDLFDLLWRFMIFKSTRSSFQDCYTRKLVWPKLKLMNSGRENLTQILFWLMQRALHRIPLHVRFGVNGFLSNVLFMIAYNEAVVRFSDVAPSSTIYSITYLLFIPVSHAFLSILVFGWPERYLPSLLSNTPIGVTAIVLGAVLTEYLDENDFNKLADDILKKNWKYLGYEIEAMPEKDKGEFYSSLLVLFVTGVWTYFLSVFVNSPVESSHKKEL